MKNKNVIDNIRQLYCSNSPHCLTKSKPLVDAYYHSSKPYLQEEIPSCSQIQTLRISKTEKRENTN